MSMKDTLKKAKIAAMKAKDKAKLNPINLTLADIQNLEIANGHEATDEEVLKVIQKGVKTRRETAKLYEDKGLADKAAPETAELNQKTREKLQELQSEGDVKVTVRDDANVVFDVGDTVTARDNLTGITVNASITKKIVKVSGGVLSVDYEAD